MPPPRLTRAERNRLDPNLLLWLDGKSSVKDLGFAPPTPPGADAVRVSVEFTSAPAAKDLKGYKALGIAAVAGETVAFGQVDRTGLATLARDARVMFVQPQYLKSPSAKGPR
jgi:hypothetical protein